MIFIYPASISENCDKRIVPAACKAIERFFLLQLQDALSSGVLSAKRNYDTSKGNYGPLLLESVNNYNKKQYLSESKILQENTKNQWDDAIDELRAKYPQVDLYDNEDKREEFKSELRKLTHDVVSDNDLNSKEKQAVRVDLNRLYDFIKAIENDISKRKSNEGKYKEYEKSKTSKTGSYRAMDSKVDIVPTGAQVDIPVLYHGGPNSGKYDKDVSVNINVKVVPVVVKNFKDIEDAMLDDYFTKQSEAFYKSIGRNIVRGVKNVLHKFGRLGDFVADKIGKNDVEKDIIYNSQGFVDASAFHKTSHSPNNYNYTSNIVIFNKDDLTDPEDGNIFKNRAAMQKMFKLGWSTFAMLDPVDEIMTFISSLDGGYMHEIPYAYMMESYGSRVYYDTNSKLKSGARPFMISKGNFATFSRKFD